MPSRRYVDEWDDDDDDYAPADDGYTEESRALARYDDSRALSATEDDFDALDAEDGDEDDGRALTIIPGAGMAPRPSFRRRKRPLTMQLVLGSVIVCVLLGALFTVTPIATATGDTLSPFSALANAVNLSSNASDDSFFWYRALPGDTFDSIAAKFSINEGGIFELNDLRADQSCIVGARYKIPTNPTYGQTYKPLLPPGTSGAGYGLPPVNIIAEKQCNFCAIAGMNNGPTGVCVSGYQTYNLSGDVTQYNLSPPNPGSSWGRGFSAFHSGVDISTGKLGTPIVAAQDGQVYFADNDKGGGGNTIKINHCGGLATSYSHLDHFAVKVGDNVKRGDIIGYQGNTGESFGTHLHFMTWWYNIPFDPVCAYPAGLDGVTLAKEGAAYGGCPPSLSHASVWWSN